jgi:hypothetical protein
MIGSERSLDIIDAQYLGGSCFAIAGRLALSFFAYSRGAQASRQSELNLRLAIADNTEGISARPLIVREIQIERHENLMTINGKSLRNRTCAFAPVQVLGNCEYKMTRPRPRIVYLY